LRTKAHAPAASVVGVAGAAGDFGAAAAVVGCADIVVGQICEAICLSGGQLKYGDTTNTRGFAFISACSFVVTRPITMSPRRSWTGLAS